MSSKNNIVPIGKLLQNAGLISDEQLEIALGVQSQHAKMRLGDILALQEAVEVQTINFFVNEWRDIEQEGRQFPLGYYFKKAYLLNEKQIEAILTEQSNTKLKFGDIAVQKGWVERETVDFFLNALAFKTPKLMSLIDLEEYNRRFLHLEKKYANASLILSRVLAWTGGNPELSKTICHAFSNSNLNISAGMEVNAVDKLIESSLIKNWQTSKLGSNIRSINKNLIDSQKCNPISLLSEYQDILQSDRKEYKKTKEQNELLALGIIIEDSNYLRVTNLIFQQIFDRDWVVNVQKMLNYKIKQSATDVAEKKMKASTIESIQTSSIIQAERNKIDNIRDINNYQEKPELTEITTKFSSLFTLAGIILFIPLVLVVNNYSSSLRQERKLMWENTSQASKLKQFCSDLNIVDSLSAIELISQLEKNKQAILRSFPNTLEGFPDNCETALNQLRVLAVPQLGKESRVIEAIKNLCKISADADNINEAKVWIEHWKTSPSWGKEVKSYLNLVNDCPAGK